MAGINNLIYFDNNATTRMDDRVAEAMRHAGNSSVSQLQEAGREKMSRLIQCKPSELFFTTGITDAIHIALHHLFEAYKHKGHHIIASCIEHGEVLKALEDLTAKGAEITYLPVNPEGLIDPEQLEAAILPTTIAACIMAANNHTGVIQPMERISQICEKYEIVFFSDASQFVGKMRCDVDDPRLDAMVFGSHKMHGPKEIGVIYARENTALFRQMSTGYKDQVQHNAELLTGFARAAEIFAEDHWENSAHVSRIKNYFEHQLLDIEGLRINGSTRYRLYNTSNITFPAQKNISSLAAQFKFLSYNKEMFYVLKAMGVSEDEMPHTFRFSFGKDNTLEEVTLLVEKIMKL